MEYSELDGEADPRRTDCTEFNDLVDAVEKVFAGRALVPEAQEALERADLALGAMLHRFLEGLALREHTPLVQDVAADLDDRFQALRSSLPRIASGLEAYDEAEVRSELDRALEHVQGVCASFRRLRNEDESRSRASESPYADELVRVGRAFLKGRVPYESLRLAVGRFEEYHRLLTTGLQALEPSAREKSVFEEARLGVHLALSRQEEAILDLRRFLEDWDEDRVQPALEAILQSTEELVAVQRRLVEAGQHEERLSCPWCGTPNLTSERFCRGCSAVLPRPAPEFEAEEPRLDLLESEGGPRGQYEHLARLAAAVSDVKRGLMEPQAFADLLEAMDSRVRQAEARLARMEEPPPETPPDQMEIYRAARQAFVDGASRIREGLTLMRAWLRDGSPHLLERGLETALAAGDDMATMERLWQEVLARSG